MIFTIYKFEWRLLCKLFVVIISSCFLCSLKPTFAKSSSAKVRAITSFPFILLDGGIIIIKAAVGDHRDSLNFILDTGCTGVSLDSATADELKLTSTISNRTINGIALLKKARFVYNQTLHLPNLAINGLEYHINDYSFLINTYGLKVNGVLGDGFFKSYTVKVDYDNQVIEVWKPGGIKYPKHGSLLKLHVERLPLFSVNVKDKTSIQSRYIFDTGADMCLFLASSFVVDSNVLNKNKKMIEVQTEGPGGKQNMQYTAVKQIQIGKYSFKNVPSLVFKDDYNVTAYPKSTGIIGSELLRRFNLIINYPDGEIFISPNSRFNEPFNYNYTGFRILEVDGHAVIDDVVENSPADKAGLQQGDIIFGLNNTFSNNMCDLKKAVLSARNNLKVSVFRNNELKVMVVAMQSII